MDLNALKLHLIERILAIEGEAVLHAVKEILDASRTYEAPADRTSVVHEDAPPYPSVDERSYSAAEVRILLEQVARSVREQLMVPDGSLGAEEWAELDADHEAYLSGEGGKHAWEEVRVQLRKDRGR